MKTIDFAKLDLRDALDLAILIEEEARERYEELSKQVGGRHEGMPRMSFWPWPATRRSTVSS